MKLKTDRLGGLHDYYLKKLAVIEAEIKGCATAECWTILEINVAKRKELYIKIKTIQDIYDLFNKP